jgi:S1-C subfamily serine protease
MMKYLPHILIISFLVVTVSGCLTSGYKQFYNPYVDAKTLPDVQLLVEGQEPQVLGTDDFDRDTRILESKRYVPIGNSNFNGPLENMKNVAAQAKQIGATIVLVGSQYTDTQTNTSTLFLPDNKTTYYPGGVATTYGTMAVPFTTTQRRYDQYAVYFVKSTQKLKLGVSLRNLTPDQRVQFQRNTGVFIPVVLEDTPAFYANVLGGDVLIEIDGQLVKNVEQALALVDDIPHEKTSTTLTVIRNSSEKEIEVKF